MRVLLLGEQATGKSSLLVAFYGALVNHRAGDMRIVRTVDEVAFLSRGLEAFGRRESVRRTEVDTPARLLVEVAHAGGAVTVELPDRSGEMLKHMIDTRIWDQELYHQITGAGGAMLFLRADEQGVEADEPAAAQADPPLGGLEADDGFAAAPPWPGVDLFWPAADDSSPEASTPSAVPDIPLEEADGDVEPPAWSPALMPADVRAVDLVQAILEERSTRLPLVVIVSAWDRAAARAALPGTWLAERVPLLHQFLTNHADQLPHVVFGVSAQGGDFEDRAPEPAAAEDPWDRAFLIGPDGTPATFAEPINWLIAAA